MKQFRKSLALLLSVLMLMTVMPLSALMVSAADENILINGDFEAGTANWNFYKNTATVVDDPTGSGQGKVMKTDESGDSVHLFDQTVNNLDANGDYILTFKVYCYSTYTTKNPGFWVTIGYNCFVNYDTANVSCAPLTTQTVDSTSSTRVRFNVTSNSARNTWIDVAIPFNMNGNTTTHIMISNYRPEAGQYYFDDFVLTKVGDDEGGDEPDEPELPDAPADYNMLKNGTFENGNADWTLVNSGTIGTEVVEDPTATGHGKVMKTDANNTANGGKNNEMFYQVVSVSPNTDYILKFKVYCYSTATSDPGFWALCGYSGVTCAADYATVSCSPMEVKATDSSSNIGSRFTAKASAGARNVWISVEMSFSTTTATSTTIAFNNYRANAGQYYFDDVVLVRADGKQEPGTEDDGEPETPDAPTVEGNLLPNGDFETGDDTGWNVAQSTTVNAEAAYTGSYGAYLSGKGTYGGMLSTTVDVVIGKSYVVKMWLKVTSMGVNVQVKADNDDGAVLGSKWCPIANYSEWTQISFVVSPTTNKLFINVCGAGEGVYETAYLDDVIVTEAPLIQNGNFETGDLSGWESHQSTAISANAAYEGSYGVNLKGNGSWGGMLNQNLPVKDGKTYELSLWYKINANGFGLQLQGVQSGTMYMNKQYKSPVGEWTQLVVTVTSVGDTAIKLNFCGVGGSSANPDLAEDVYIDNIVFTEMKSASNDGYIINGDFEYKDWSTHWTNVNGACTVSLVAGHDSTQALSIVAPKWTQVRQKFAVEANTDYQITLWAKDTTDITLILKTGSSDQNYAQKGISAGSTWTEITYTFNSGDNTSLYLGFMGGDSGNGVAVIDDVRILALKDPSFDGYVYNGDFETGVLGKWTASSSSSTYIATDAHGGVYSASVKGPGDWNGGLLTQNITIEAGKTYTLSFWYKPVTNGVNYELRTPDKSVSFDTLYLDSRKYADWTYHEVTFEAGFATEIEMTFGGSGKGSTDEVFIDDVRLVNLSGNEMDRTQALVDGGTSIRDYNDAPALAFRFFLNANGVEIKNGNQYVPGTGTLKLYRYADIYGNLKSFGAVVTNDATVGNSDFTLADTIDSKKTVDIPAVYLCDLEDDAAGYAVRIINIPNHGVGTDIYARPYYVYELDGEEYTIYGDIVKNNYASVEATRRTKRVLAIGDGYTGFESHLYDVLKAGNYDQVILGNYHNGAYLKNKDNGQWISSTIAQADLMADERWQYIVVNNADDLAWANANKPEDAVVLYYGDDVAVDTALANLATVLDATDEQKDYTAALTWFLSLTGESLDLIAYNEAFVGTEEYDMRRAAAHAWYAPSEVTDLTEVVLVSGSDFQPDNWDKGITTLQGLTGSLKNNGYAGFDGLLFGGDYTQTLGSDFDSSNEGLHVLDKEITNTVNFDKYYTQGNHDAAGIDLLSPYGNNDNPYAPYGVFIVHEDNYNAYGGGGQQVAADLTAYCNEKLANGWGNKPIFVISHINLHYNYRTIAHGGSKSASYIIEALNAASEAGLNIFFLISHNHSGGYDDYLGGAAIYIPKGDSMLVADPANVNNPPINTELKFTYMNCGYVSYYNDMGEGADTALTMCTFRIQANGDVIVTRYDANGVHNLKSAGKLSPHDRTHTEYTVADDRVYESSRIVGYNKDEEYTDE